MPLSSDYVIAYIDEHNPKLCVHCMKRQIVGLRIMELHLSRPREMGFICLSCVAETWNADDAEAIEPTAEQRGLT